MVRTERLRDKNDFWNLPVGRPFVAMFDGERKIYTLVTEKNTGYAKKIIHLYAAQDPRTPTITSYGLESAHIVSITEGKVIFDKREVITYIAYNPETEDHHRALVVRSEAVRRHS